MGITLFSTTLLEKALSANPDIKTVMELGSQNLYIDNTIPPPFANIWYEERGIKYSCIDLAGDNGALKLDLANPIMGMEYDLVTDYGTSEHFCQMKDYESVAFHDGHINSIYPKGEVTEENIRQGYYNGWLNKHNLLKIGGIMVSENPMAGNWPSHCYTWIDSNFYYKLMKMVDYEIISTGVHPALGNTKDGYNVFCVMKKLSDRFPDFETFNTLPVWRK